MMKFFVAFLLPLALQLQAIAAAPVPHFTLSEEERSAFGLLIHNAGVTRQEIEKDHAAAFIKVVIAHPDKKFFGINKQFYDSLSEEDRANGRRVLAGRNDLREIMLDAYDKGAGLSGCVIAIIVISILVAVGIIVGIVMCCVCKNKKKQQNQVVVAEP